MIEETEVCQYVENSVKPCENCPRKITCLYMCKFLQETLEQSEQSKKEDIK